MGDAYYTSYTSNPMLQQPPPQLIVGKRPRSDYDTPSGQEMSGYYAREDARPPQRQMRDSETINQSYSHYLHSGAQNPYPGADSGRLQSSSHPVDDPRRISDHRVGVDSRFGNDPRMVSDPRYASDPRMVSDSRMGSVMDPGMPVNGRGSNLGSSRAELPFPPDASNTIFVEGLPSNCTRREVAHIFRPFVGYKEVRLVTKESRRPGGDPLVLCFVDFVSPAHAATALNALQGYIFDEVDRDRAALRLQYARFPGARSGGGGGGRSGGGGGGRRSKR